MNPEESSPVEWENSRIKIQFQKAVLAPAGTFRGITARKKSLIKQCLKLLRNEVSWNLLDQFCFFLPDPSCLTPTELVYRGLLPIWRVGGTIAKELGEKEDSGRLCWLVIYLLSTYGTLCLFFRAAGIGSIQWRKFNKSKCSDRITASNVFYMILL